MTILFLLENYYPHIGGVETLFKNLVERLATSGHHSIIITSRPPQPAPAREELPGITIVRVPVWSRYLFTFVAFFAMLPYVHRCDLVHTTSYNAALPAFFGARLFGKKVIVTFHEAWGKLWFELPFMGRLAKWGHYLFEQLLLRLPFNRFVAVSESTAESLRREGVSPEKVEVIYNGIDYGEFRAQMTKDQLQSTKTLPGDPKPDAAFLKPNPQILNPKPQPLNPKPQPLNPKPQPLNPFIYTYFGRTGISKGLDLLLPAAKIVMDKLPDSRLQLIIPREPRAFLEWIQYYVQENRMDDYVLIRHALPFAELKEAVRNSDAVVIPSYSEGFCFAAVEAIALGTPVISSGRAALREVVGGRYLEMNDFSAEALAMSILQAAGGNWVERPVREFSLADTVEGYLNLYNRSFR